MRSWPQIRGVLVALHVLAIIVLSLPSSNTLVNRRGWKTPNAKAEFRTWAQRLSNVGYEVTPQEFEQKLWGVATTFAAGRERVAGPFHVYGNITGARQGWQMFATPQKYPAELHVDIKVEGEWRKLVRPWDERSTWRLRQRSHNRFRKQLGRFARTFYRERYDGLTLWLATEAARDFPEATEIRAGLYRYHSLPPDRVLAGEQPEGHYEHERSFDAEALR